MSTSKASMKAAYLEKLVAEMESRLGCKIDVVEDVNSNYPSKIEYARNYARQSHVLRVNPKRCAARSWSMRTSRPPTRSTRL